MFARERGVELLPYTDEFLVIDGSRSVSNLSHAMSIIDVKWIVIETAGPLYFVLSVREVQKSIHDVKGGVPLSVALQLDSDQSSHVVRNGILPPRLAFRKGCGPSANRAVFLNKAQVKQLWIVMSVGELRPELGKAKSIIGSVRQKHAMSGHSISKSPRKALRSKCLHPRVAGGGLRRRADEPRQAGLRTSQYGTPPKQFRIVRVFYATDRAVKMDKSRGALLGFRNERNDNGRLTYGTCDVSVPYDRRLGTLETPTIWKLEFQANPAKHFLIHNCASQTELGFFRQINATVKSSDGSAFVFIHGFNVSFNDAAMRVAQLAVDLQFKGVAICYSWPSRAKETRYIKDEESNQLSKPQLVRFLQDLSERSGAKVIHVIAHSMGNRLLIRALDELSKRVAATNKQRFKQVILTAPDIGKDEVLQISDAIRASAERVTLYASKRDKALLASTKIHGYARAGFVVGQPFIFPGIDTIDATSVSTDFIAHSPFAKSRTILTDLYDLFGSGNDPDRRFGLERMGGPGGRYWAFKK